MTKNNTEKLSNTPYIEYLDKMIVSHNAVKGNLKGVDCSICHNSGRTFFRQGDEEVLQWCPCRSSRESIENIKRSGLESTIQELSFGRFIAKEDWQKRIKLMAEEYTQNGDGYWFFIGGQPGSGKTHLCTAIADKLLKDGKSLKYMMWCDESTRLKAVVNDCEEYEKRINEIKNVEVLYVDDLFKTQQGANPTPADVRLAFEILNYRYVSKKRTIISSEKRIEAIKDIDEAIGSRIAEMTRVTEAKKYCYNIALDKSKNYRTKQRNDEFDQIDAWSKQ